MDFPVPPVFSPCSFFTATSPPAIIPVHISGPLMKIHNISPSQLIPYQRGNLVPENQFSFILLSPPLRRVARAVFFLAERGATAEDLTQRPPKHSRRTRGADLIALAPATTGLRKTGGSRVRPERKKQQPTSKKMKITEDKD